VKRVIAVVGLCTIVCLLPTGAAGLEQTRSPSSKAFTQCGSYPGIFTYGLRAEGVSCSRAKRVLDRFIGKSTSQDFRRVVKFGSWRCVSKSYGDGQDSKCKRGDDHQVRFSRGG